MDVKVCIGSCCHKRNSYSIIKVLKNLVEENNLCASVHILSSFCLGQCKDGVTIEVNEKIITGITLDNIDEVFSKYINV